MSRAKSANHRTRGAVKSLILEFEKLESSKEARTKMGSEQSLPKTPSNLVKQRIDQFDYINVPARKKRYKSALEDGHSTYNFQRSKSLDFRKEKPKQQTFPKAQLDKKPEKAPRADESNKTLSKNAKTGKTKRVPENGSKKLSDTDKGLPGKNKQIELPDNILSDKRSGEQIDKFRESIWDGITQNFYHGDNLGHQETFDEDEYNKISDTFKELESDIAEMKQLKHIENIDVYLQKRLSTENLDDDEFGQRSFGSFENISYTEAYNRLGDELIETSVAAITHRTLSEHLKMEETFADIPPAAFTSKESLISENGPTTRERVLSEDASSLEFRFSDDEEYDQKHENGVDNPIYYTMNKGILERPNRLTLCFNSTESLERLFDKSSEDDAEFETPSSKGAESGSRTSSLSELQANFGEEAEQTFESKMFINLKNAKTGSVKGPEIIERTEIGVFQGQSKEFCSRNASLESLQEVPKIQILETLEVGCPQPSECPKASGCPEDSEVGRAEALEVERVEVLPVGHSEVPEVGSSESSEVRGSEAPEVGRPDASEVGLQKLPEIVRPRVLKMRRSEVSDYDDSKELKAQKNSEALQNSGNEAPKLKPRKIVPEVVLEAANISELTAPEIPPRFPQAQNQKTLQSSNPNELPKHSKTSSKHFQGNYPKKTNQPPILSSRKLSENSSDASPETNPNTPTENSDETNFKKRNPYENVRILENKVEIRKQSSNGIERTIKTETILYDNFENPRIAKISNVNTSNGSFSDRSLGDKENLESPVSTKSKIDFIIEELIETEKKYIKHLEKIVWDYMPVLSDDRLPSSLIGKSRYLFANIRKIYSATQKFYKALRSCNKDHEEIAKTFIAFKQLFELYPYYSKNKPTADQYLIGDFKEIVSKREKQLKDRLGLASNLLTPIQRLGKYILFLEQIQKELSKKEYPSDNIYKAIETVRKQMSRGNDYIAIDSIKESPISLIEQGSFLMREKFNVIKPRKYEAMLFLFEEILVLTTVDPRNPEMFIYRDGIKLNEMGIKFDDDPHVFHLRRFSSHKKGLKESNEFMIHSKKERDKKIWTEEIEKRLWEQLVKCREEQRELHNNQGKRNSVVELPKSPTKRAKEGSATLPTKHENSRKSVFYCSIDVDSRR